MTEQESQKGGENQGGTNPSTEQKPFQSGESSPNAGKTQDKPAGQLGPIIVAIIIIMIGAFLYSRTAKAPEDESSTVNNDQGSTEEVMEADEGEGTEGEGEEADIVESADSAFEDREDAERTINETQGKTEVAGTFEKITEGVVEDGDEENMVYFATTDRNQNGTFLGIYRYNTENNNWWRLHKETFTPEDGKAQKVYRVVGKEGRNLIILVDTLDRKQDDCESPYLLQDLGLELIRMNVDTPKDGFVTFEVIDSLKESERERVEECLKG